MNIDIDTFTDDQKNFLAQVVDDFGGPTSTASVLMVLERALYTLKPDFDFSTPHETEKELYEDLEVCMAALHYWKVQNVAETIRKK
jgi:hypothetical protein